MAINVKLSLSSSKLGSSPFPNLYNYNHHCHRCLIMMMKMMKMMMMMMMMMIMVVITVMMMAVMITMMMMVRGCIERRRPLSLVVASFSSSPHLGRRRGRCLRCTETQKSKDKCETQKKCEICKQSPYLSIEKRSLVMRKVMLHK